jgi:signal transduction histidine kinase
VKRGGGGSRRPAFAALALALLVAACSAPPDDNALFLGGNGAKVYVDRSGTLGFAEARARRNEFFAGGPGAGLPAAGAPPGAAIWLDLPAPDPDALLAAGWDRPFAVLVKEPGIRHVDLYLASGNAVLERNWDWLNERRLAGNGYRYPLLGFEPSQLRNAVLLMRIVPSAPLEGAVWLSDFQSFFGNYNAETTALSLAIGVLFAVLIYILALGSTLRSRTNLWLAAAIAAQLVNIVCASGVFETQILPAANQTSLTLAAAARVAVEAALVAFAANFLRLREHRPAAKRASRVAVAVLFCLAAAAALLPHAASLPLFPWLAAGTVGIIAVLSSLAVPVAPGRAASLLLCWLPTLVPLLARSTHATPPAFADNLAFDDATLFGLSASFVLFAVLASVEIRRREKVLRGEILHNVDRFRGFAEIGTDSFWEVDGAGRLTFLSGREIGPARLAVGDVLADRLEAASSADYVRPIRQTIAGRLPLDDRRVRLADGDRDVWIGVSGRAIVGAPDDRAGVYRGIIRDVTEETEREGRRVVEQQMLALGQLVGSVAHEVNNLIHPIVNLTKRLRNRGSGTADAESARLMELIDTSSRQAAKVVSELLRSTRDGRWKDIDRPLSLAVEYSVEAVRPALPASVKVDIVTEKVLNPSVKMGDILQLVGNLVSNAVHAMDGRGHVAISLVSLPEGGRLTVSDDGAGMDETVRQRAMQPFFTTKTDGRGTGVGLYVVQRIVRDYGGWITIDSTPGLGTTFTILFPFRKDDDGTSAEHPDGARG